ncbi:MAG: HEAT repeat domain-containing protein [Planctomycetota bacterium]|jgi:HEAT repeat protein
MARLLCVLLALAPLGFADEFDDLIAELVDEDAYVRELARRALVRKGRDALPTLRKAAASENRQLREQAAKVLGDIGREAQDALPTLKKLAKDADPGVRAAAKEALGKLQAGSRAEKNLAALSDGDRAELLAALASPDTLGPANVAVPQLLRILSKRDDVLKAAAGKAIGRFGDKARFAVPKLIEIGRTAAPAQRFAIVDALSGIGAACVQPLFKTYTVDSRSRAWIDEIFHRLGPLTIGVALPALNDSKDANERVAACRMLGAAGAGAQLALPALVNGLHDSAGKVRRAAADALGAMGASGLDASPALTLLAGDADRRAQLEAVRALGSILRSSAADLRSAPKVATRYDQSAIRLGLGWLVAHRLGDSGAWGSTEKPGEPNYSTGMTGLALMALIEGGIAAEHEAVVQGGLRHLIANQDAEGVYGARNTKHFLYNHLAATLAMCFAYGETSNPTYGRSAQRALDFIAAARSHAQGGWRYVPGGGDADTSMTGWAVHALHAGQMAGLNVDADAFAGTRAYIEKATNAKSGLVGYMIGSTVAARPTEMRAQFPEEKTRAMAAAGALALYNARSKPSLATIEQCLGLLPAWDLQSGSLDMYYWHAGTRLMLYVKGAPWQKWAAAMRKAAHKGHVRKGPDKGAWPAVGPWANDGGPVYSTAMMVMCLKALDGRVWPLRLKIPRSPRLRPAYMVLRNAARHPDDRISKAAKNALLPFGD